MKQADPLARTRGAVRPPKPRYQVVVPIDPVGDLVL